jgi:glyoxylase-like metal-dependent hydrolase (beta-lactamase superfamily II)
MTLHLHPAEGIHRIEDAYTNWFIVDEDGRLSVVDAGVPRSWDSPHAALDALGRGPQDVEAVVLTHAHFDHVGFAEKARSQLGVPRVRARERRAADAPSLALRPRAAPLAVLRHPAPGAAGGRVPQALRVLAATVRQVVRYTAAT